MKINVDINKLCDRLFSWQNKGLIKHQAEFWMMGRGSFNEQHYQKVIEAKRKQNNIK